MYAKMFCIASEIIADITYVPLQMQ